LFLYILSWMIKLILGLVNFLTECRTPSDLEPHRRPSPSLVAFLFRLWKVILPVLRSISSWNPLHQTFHSELPRHQWQEVLKLHGGACVYTHTGTKKLLTDLWWVACRIIENEYGVYIRGWSLEVEASVSFLEAVSAVGMFVFSFSLFLLLVFERSKN
jgi:hypothetical protein